MVNAMFKSYEKPVPGVADVNDKGKLVSMAAGSATAFALNLIQVSLPLPLLFLGLFVCSSTTPLGVCVGGSV